MLRSIQLRSIKGHDFSCIRPGLLSVAYRQCCLRVVGLHLLHSTTFQPGVLACCSSIACSCDFHPCALPCGHLHPRDHLHRWLLKTIYLRFQLPPPMTCLEGLQPGGLRSLVGQGLGARVWRSSSRCQSKVVLCNVASESCGEEKSLSLGRDSSRQEQGPITRASASVKVAPNVAPSNGSSLYAGALDFRGLAEGLNGKFPPGEKEIVLVRHGLSSWNAEGRIQGSSDQSVLSDMGKVQVQRCREALSRLSFDTCFASPIARARSSAELIWEGRDKPIQFLDSLREANLLFLEGMRNVDARDQYPQLYRAWREDPANFHVDGVYPIRDLWSKARHTWEEILSAPGELVVVVSHKSILRALLCTALGMGPERFRSIDINNAAVSSVIISTEGNAMLKSLNMTAHLHADGVYYRK